MFDCSLSSLQIASELAISAIILQFTPCNADLLPSRDKRQLAAISQWGGSDHRGAREPITERDGCSGDQSPSGMGAKETNEREGWVLQGQSPREMGAKGPISARDGC